MMVTATQDGIIRERFSSSHDNLSNGHSIQFIILYAGESSLNGKEITEFHREHVISQLSDE